MLLGRSEAEMGRYDDIDPEEVRRHVVRVARLILRMDEEGRLLREAPRLQKLFGDLRQRLFAYEVRCTADLGPSAASEEDDGAGTENRDDPVLSESLRIVREALERQQELTEELDSGPPPPEGPEEEED
ncbi:MAG: hypothetical protein ACLFWG_08350 [Longimicrobiales bacterium]